MYLGAEGHHDIGDACLILKMVNYLELFTCNYTVYFSTDLLENDGNTE